MTRTKTPATLERRLVRLEAHALTPPFASRPDRFPPPSPEAVRAVLKMLVEMGALTPSPAGAPDRWRELRHTLFGPDSLAASRGMDEGGSAQGECDEM